jgi:hypothetical protein
MTRAERLAEEIRKSEERLREQRARASEARRHLREYKDGERAAKRKRVGLAVDEAGLFVWDETTLGLLFRQLARLRKTPNPVAVLDALLSDHDTPVLVAVPVESERNGTGESVTV